MQRSNIVKVSTEALAARFGIQPQTVRASLCRRGHWCNLRPVKLPNGRLLWSVAEIDALLNGEAL